MRYMLSVEVKLVELPEPEAPSSSSDPIETLGKMAGGLMTMVGPGSVVSMPRMPGGIEFRRSVAVTVSHFAGCAKIVGQFDDLTSEIQLERP